MVERRKQIEIEEQEIRRKEKELMSTVKLPAEAEAYKVQTIAEGKRQEIRKFSLKFEEVNHEFAPIFLQDPNCGDRAR